MKLVFDFDDTIFDSQRFKEERMYTCLVESGVTVEEFKASYEEHRRNNSIHDIHKHLREIIAERGLAVSPEDIIYSMVQNIESYVFPEYLDLLKQYGRENIFVLTQGTEQFQTLKILHSNVEEQIEKSIIVQGGKEEQLNNLASIWQETILFFDDKVSNLLFSAKENNIIPVFVGDVETLTDEQKGLLQANNIRFCHRSEIQALIPTLMKEHGIELSQELVPNRGRII